MLFLLTLQEDNFCGLHIIPGNQSLKCGATFENQCLFQSTSI